MWLQLHGHNKSTISLYVVANLLQSVGLVVHVENEVTVHFKLPFFVLVFVLPPE